MKFVAAAALASVVSAECMKGIKLEGFSDKDCKTLYKGADEKEMSHEITEAEARHMNKPCIATPAKDQAYWKAKGFDAKTMKVQCDTSNIKTTFYTSTCMGDTKEVSMVWGECKKFTIDEQTVYMKVTGAMALQAAAAAALAIV